MLKLYNTLTRKKEEFKALKDKKVGIYSCGPTVYWYQHIGNLRSYIFSDVLKRVLLYNGYKIKHVMNVTDVGHLTSDADTGEDKIEEAAKREHKDAWQIAEFYWKIFREDFAKLNISEPNIWCKATEHVEEQIELIKKLEKKGYTYKTSDGIYFNTSKFENYGQLAKLKKQDLQAGKRIAMGEKKHKTDFALWKFSEKPGERQQEWDSPWGIGFPGWHIECSAMSMKYLGEHFDVHTGGEDHVPVHHTNEIAQSEGATGKKLANYWLHGAFLLSKGKKISKSKGGLYTISELQEKGFEPLAYRYLCLTAHYRTQLNFSLDVLKNAQNSYKRLKRLVHEIKDDKKTNKQYEQKFLFAINNDLDMPSALGVLWELVRDKKAKGKLETIKKFDKVLGLNLLGEEKEKPKKEIIELAEKRKKAREETNFELSDKLREDIRKRGWQVEDTAKGYKLVKI